MNFLNYTYQCNEEMIGNEIDGNERNKFVVGCSKNFHHKIRPTLLRDDLEHCHKCLEISFWKIFKIILFIWFELH